MSSRAKQSLWDETGGKCVFCDAVVPVSERSRDHIWPKSKGGTLHRENILPACRNCNTSRGTLYPPSLVVHANWMAYVVAKEGSSLVLELRKAWDDAEGPLTGDYSPIKAVKSKQKRCEIRRMVRRQKRAALKAERQRAKKAPLQFQPFAVIPSLP
jgi:hypothetical protein